MGLIQRYVPKISSQNKQGVKPFGKKGKKGDIYDFMLLLARG